jgi:adenylosuccinate synthase
MAKKSKVGRGNPPKHTRFRKGQSGNPKGRPKGSKNLSTILMEAAGEEVIANIGGRSRRITTLQATAIQLATKAAGGDRNAIAKFLDWMDEFEKRAAAARPADFPFSSTDLDVLRKVHRRMQACTRPKGV